MASGSTPHRLSASDWDSVNELFPEALALQPGDRAAFLDRSCGAPAVRAEIESLLGFAGAGDGMDADASSALADAASALAAELPFEEIGPYRLVSEIGRGGMGAVYLAERSGDGFTQRVAIKLVRGFLSPDGLRRFRAERRILASLAHPNVARLIDGGTTPGGLPYLVMEYVDGEPIDRYCHSRGLPVAARIDLFRQVCDAVTHAHRSLIVHRDLKPSNILVTADGTPKLLDFGIAKLLDDDQGDGAMATSASMRVMTPEYASPEQVRGAPITIATDVYSLGVLLFELLAGVRPYQFESRDAGHVALIVSLHEAPKPSSVADPQTARHLRGDLDTIVLAALSKDPARRYLTVEQLSDDLRRYREGRPIHARPATWRYRTTRFLGRHRYAAATAAGAVLLVAGLALALASSARRTAQERDTAERVTALLVDMFSATDPAQTRGGTITARELLDRGAASIEQGLKEQPEVRAQLLDALGNVYFALGQWEPAERLLTNSLDARRQVGDLDSIRTAATMHRLADVLVWRGHGQASAKMIGSALDIRRRILGPRHSDVAASLAIQARAMTTLARPFSEIEQVYLQAIDIWRGDAGADSPDAAIALVQIARGRVAEADFAGAESAARESLDIRRRAFGEVHPLTAESLVTLAQVVEQAGRPAESEPLSREVLAVRRKLYGTDDHPFVHQALNQLAIVLAGQGKLAEADPVSVLSSDQSRLAIGLFNGVAANLRVRGGILEDLGRAAEAEAAYRRCVDGSRTTPNGDVQLALSQTSLARLLARSGRAAAALPSADEAVAGLRKRFGERHFQVAPALLVRAQVLSELGRHDDADAAFRETLAIQRTALPPQHPALIASLTAYGIFLLENGDATGAEPLLAEAHHAQQSSLPAGHWSRPWTALAYGAARTAGGHDDGAAISTDALARLSQQFAAGDPHLREARRLMALSAGKPFRG